MKGLVKHTLVRYTVYENHWLWFHILFGVLVGKLALVFAIAPQIAVVYIAGGGSLLWEVIQYLRGEWRDYSPIKSKVYQKQYETSQKQHYLLDALADIGFAVLACLMVVF